MLYLPLHMLAPRLLPDQTKTSAALDHLERGEIIGMIVDPGCKSSRTLLLLWQRRWGGCLADMSVGRLEMILSDINRFIAEPHDFVRI